MDFTAIDFETASHRKDSACQLAAVRVRSGAIIDSACWLIRPEPCYFSPGNIRIHGITPGQVEHESNFGDLWQGICHWFENECLVAHNASFDMGVMLACLRAHRKSIPEFEFTCTRSIARQAWPGRRGYGLKPLSDWLGTKFNHHDALEDSVACAKILLAAADSHSADSISELESRLGLQRGAAGDWGYKGASVKRRSAGTAGPRSRARGSRVRGSDGRGSGAQGSLAYRAEDPSLANPEHSAHRPRTSQSAAESASPLSSARMGGVDTPVDLQRLLVRAQFIQPLADQLVVFTGRLKTLPREQAIELAIGLGGQCQNTVNEQTSLLVVGELDERTRAAGREVSVKEQAARKRTESGQVIRIVDERAFLELILHKDTVKDTVCSVGKRFPT